MYTAGNQSDNNNSVTAISLFGLFSKEIISTTPLSINIDGEKPSNNQAPEHNRSNTFIDSMYRLRLMENNPLWRSLPFSPKTIEETSLIGSTTEYVSTPGNIQPSEPYSSNFNISGLYHNPYLRTLAITPKLYGHPSVDNDNQTSFSVSYNATPNLDRPIIPNTYWQSLPVTRNVHTETSIDRKAFENQNITESRLYISSRSFTTRVRNRTAVYTTTTKYRIRKNNLTKTNKIKPVKRVVPVVSVAVQSSI